MTGMKDGRDVVSDLVMDICAHLMFTWEGKWTHWSKNLLFSYSSKKTPQILLKGFLDCWDFLNKRALPLIEQVLFGRVHRLSLSFPVVCVQTRTQHFDGDTRHLCRRLGRPCGSSGWFWLQKTNLTWSTQDLVQKTMLLTIGQVLLLFFCSKHKNETVNESSSKTTCVRSFLFYFAQ